ncbi:MAG: sodium:glutamate symporter [Lachnospiraceae bacterium]|nr:sodium:glutamate symporter [Lachnospiraceae bacterium]
MTIASLKADFLLMSVFLLIGFFVRARFKIFRRLFIPASLIGGVLLLIIGQQGFGLVTVPDSYSGFSSGLIDIILASLVLGISINKERLQSYLEYSFITMTAYGMQLGVGALLGVLLQKVWSGLPDGWGTMGVFAFHGGHGTAAAAGTEFETVGLAGNMAVGMVLSTFGLIVSMTIGIIIVNYGVRKNWGTYVNSGNLSSKIECDKNGPLPEEERTCIGRLVVPSKCINHLALQFAWLLFSVWVGKMLFKTLGNYIEFFGKLPSVLHGIIGGAILWFVLIKTKRDYLVDMRTIKQITSFLLEIVVFAAMATLDLEFVGTYMIPLLIYSTILSIISIVIILVFSKKFLKNEWFEKACMAIGAATGTTSTGLALVRTIDPDARSSAGDTHGVYSTVMSWKDVFVGIIPMWFATGAFSGVLYSSIAGFAIMIAAAVLAFVFRENR